MDIYYKQNHLNITYIGIALIIAMFCNGCGNKFTGETGLPGAQGNSGATGATGEQGYGAGIYSEAISGLCGNVDGIRITTFQDKNNNGIKDIDEMIASVTSLCNGHNGLNGTNGTNSSITINNTAPSCSNGGYTMVVTNGAIVTSYPICNGLNGANGNTGPQGPQGIQGLQGLTGAAGTTVTPIKFCNNDPSLYPEYGLYIGNRLFAVYWGDTPASPGNSSQAFLAEITPGNYVSTGGNGCTFTIN